MGRLLTLRFRMFVVGFVAMAATFGLAVAQPVSAVTSLWSLCYSAPGSGCTTHAVASNRVPTWSVPSSSCLSAYCLRFQSDCNLVVYKYKMQGVVWASGTNTIPRPCTLKWQGDGNVVIYDHYNRARWATNTNHGTKPYYYMQLLSNGCLRIWSPWWTGGTLWSRC